MSEELPPPLVPGDVDLRDFPFTPLFRARLFGSSFHARSTDAQWRAGVTLWLKSWDQVPAGTLPDDEIDLCRLAELGRDVKTWRKVSTGALHGWVKCSDGRLHHPVVAEGVLDAWATRRKQSKRGKAGADEKWRKHREALAQAAQTDGTSIPQPMAQAGLPASASTAQAMLSDSKGREEKRREGKKDSVPNGTGEPPTDEQAFEKWFWQTGKAALAKVSIPAGKAGALLGRWKAAGRDQVLQAISRALDRDCDANALVAYVEASLDSKRLSGKVKPLERKPIAPRAGTPEFDAMYRDAGG